MRPDSLFPSLLPKTGLHQEPRQVTGVTGMALGLSIVRNLHASFTDVA